MEISVLISLAALFVALLSALYANHSVTEARRANEISLHNEKLKIFKGILDLRATVTGRGTDIEERELFCFYEHVQLSEFYYDSKIHQQIKDYFDCVWDIVKRRSEWGAAEKESQELYKQMVKKTFAILEESRKKVSALEEAMKEHLRLVKPAGSN